MGNQKESTTGSIERYHKKKEKKPSQKSLAMKQRKLSPKLLSQIFKTQESNCLNEIRTQCRDERAQGRDGGKIRKK